MSYGMTWLAGFIIGAVVVFIVMHAFVWYPRYVELRQRWADERARRIEAEDTEAFAYGSSAVAPTRKDWDEAIPTPVRREYVDGLDDDGRPRVRQALVVPEGVQLVDLTDIDDVPEAP